MASLSASRASENTRTRSLLERGIVFLGFAAVMGALFLVGCRLSVARIRSGVPLKVDAYETLREGETSLSETLEKLGAPDRAKWETGKDRLSWDHLDTAHVNVRFQIPFSLYGYRHNIFQYFENQDQANTIDLLFNEDGTLEQKSLRLPHAYNQEESRGRGWRVHLTPRLERSFLIVGSADFDRYSDIFQNGMVAGLDLSLQPVAPLVFTLGGNYQNYQGETVDGYVLLPGESDPSLRRINVHDLHLYNAEARLRLQLPLRLFADAESFKNFWTILLDDDPQDHDGWLVFVEAGLGILTNGNVPVKIDGVRQGTLFDTKWLLSSSGATGIEYSWKFISARLGISYRVNDGFNEGNSPLEANAGAFQTWGATASVAIKF